MDTTETPEQLMESARTAIGAAESVLKGARQTSCDHGSEAAECMAGAAQLCIEAMVHAAKAAHAVSAVAFDITDSAGSEYRVTVDGIAYEAAEYAAKTQQDVWKAEAIRAEEVDAYEGCANHSGRCMCPFHVDARQTPAASAVGGANPMAASHIDVSVPATGGSIRLHSSSGALEALWIKVRDDEGAQVCFDRATGRHLAAAVRLTPSEARALSDLLRRYADTHAEIGVDE